MHMYIYIYIYTYRCRYVVCVYIYIYICIAVNPVTMHALMAEALRFAKLHIAYRHASFTAASTPSSTQSSSNDFMLHAIRGGANRIQQRAGPSKLPVTCCMPGASPVPQPLMPRPPPKKTHKLTNTTHEQSKQHTINTINLT